VGSIPTLPTIEKGITKGGIFFYAGWRIEPTGSPFFIYEKGITKGGIFFYAGWRIEPTGSPFFIYEKGM
jgi:hypothetical protein